MRTAAGVAALPLPALLRSTAVLHACASDSLVRAAGKLLSRAPRAAPDLLLRQFVAGESLKDASLVAARLGSSGVRCIVDHSTEEAEEEHARQHNLDSKRTLLRTLSAALGGSCAYVPLKVTGLISPLLLEQLSVGIRRAAASASSPHTLPDGLDEAADAAQLDSSESAQLSVSLDRMRSLCDVAADVNVGLLLDAEQNHRQPAIRLLARTLALEFNASVSRPPLLFDTHQTYLVGCYERLADDLEHARRHGYTLGVKLVRGAYRSTEAARDASALQPSKTATDEAYDACAQMLLEAALADGAPAAASLLLATHNRASTEFIADELRSRGVRLDHPRVGFAQILGMADDLTLSLGIDGFNAYKLVTYGRNEQVLPWLLRRLEENQDALAAAAEERPLLRAEVRRRALRAIGLG